jgi:hypothetical protein
VKESEENGEESKDAKKSRKIKRSETKKQFEWYSLNFIITSGTILIRRPFKAFILKGKPLRWNNKDRN